MMLSRRMPKASPGARSSLKRNPSSSGPRCRIAAVIAFTRDSASVLRVVKATPQIPHTLFFDLRRREEGCARSDYVRSEEHTSELQSLTNLVCRLLLEKKKKKLKQHNTIYSN